MGLIKKPFFLQFSLQLLKGDLDSADAFGFQKFENQLVGSPWFIDADPAKAHHVHPVFRKKPQTFILPTKHHRADLGVRVFQRKIKMP